MKWWSVLKLRWISSQKEIPSFYHDISDEDGYCTCSICQKQKKEEEEKNKEKLKIPDEMFEL